MKNTPKASIPFPIMNCLLLLILLLFIIKVVIMYIPLQSKLFQFVYRVCYNFFLHLSTNYIKRNTEYHAK